MRAALALAACLACRAAVGEWTPPANRDPQSILEEARADARARNYETALAKHVWFHEHALETHPSLSGVRLSFALRDWADLGRAYPPALKKLKEVRDATWRRLDPTQGGKPTFEDFHDLASINRKLKEDDSTVAAFRLLDEHDAKAAQRAFQSAMPALVAAKEYKLCGKYLEPERSAARLTFLYESNLKLAADPRLAGGAPVVGDVDVREILRTRARESFMHDAATLVALLALNDRQDEAEKAALGLRKVEADEDFRAALTAAFAKALDGEMPAPEP